MLIKPDNWSQNFVLWLDSVENRERVYTDCLEALLDMFIVTYKLSKLPDDYRVYESVARGKYDNSDDNSKLVRRRVARDVSNLLEQVKLTCEKTDAPAVGTFGLMFINGSASIYIVTSDSECIVPTGNELEKSKTNTLESHEGFLGWWRY